MNEQTRERIKIMRSFAKRGKTLEIGIAGHKITNGTTLDCVEKYNPDILCNLNEEAIPVDDEQFDCVVAGEVLEHLLNPYNVVREFYRVLKPNGVLVVSVPNIASLSSRIKLLFGRMPTHACFPMDKIDAERHLVDFNFEFLEDVLEKANFKIQKIGSNGIVKRDGIITRFISPKFGENLIVKCIKYQHSGWHK